MSVLTTPPCTCPARFRPAREYHGGPCVPIDARTCPTCHGRGTDPRHDRQFVKVTPYDDCPRCDGEGWV